MSARHSGDNRDGQGADPTWVYFPGAGGGRDDQPGDNAFLAKKCQQILSVDGTISSSWLILRARQKGACCPRHCDYNAAFAGGATRLGVAAYAGLVFGQGKGEEGMRGRRLYGSRLRHLKGGGARSAVGRCAALGCRVPGALGQGGRSPVEAPAGRAVASWGATPCGPALCSDAVEPNARRRGAAEDQTESLILAQNERWRRA